MHSKHADSLTKWAWLSIAAAVITIGMKLLAYALTGSVGLLSDALESLVNLVAAIIALIALTIAARPADARHHYGHGKIEYFSAGAEGLMIVVAAILIAYEALQRLIAPEPLQDVGIGLAITIAATVINGAVGLLVIRAGRRARSLTLVADGKHLMTDVWTSVGVVIGVALVALTGWLPLDSLIAFAVAANIIWTAIGLIRAAVRGLLDHAMDDADVAVIRGILNGIMDEYPAGEVSFHALQTRESGRERFVSVHTLVPGAWTVTQGHDLVERCETAVRAAVPGVHMISHLEPIEDPRSHGDSFGGIAVTDAD